MATLREAVAIEKAIAYTNKRIEKWYKTVKEDYNIVGSGKAHYSKKDNKVVVEYIENGDQKTWEMPFYPEYLRSGINYIYDCWSSLA